MRFLAQPLISLCYTAFHHDLVFLHLTAEYCTSYTDWNGVSHRTQQCSMSYYCCGDCTYKYCCRDQTQRITQSQQERSCFNQDTLPGVNTNKTNRPGVLLGSILGSVFPIILCVGLIICCVAPCCLCYKKCRKGGNRTHTGRPQVWLYGDGENPVTPGVVFGPDGGGQEASVIFVDSTVWWLFALNK
uniref:Shisa N-terminal domain-containing protein n=1 Tax=Amphiprion ocellaris TaxID=80972 RepID=A0AAQ5Z9H2_AMPOC